MSWFSTIAHHFFSFYVQANDPAYVGRDGNAKNLRSRSHVISYNSKVIRIVISNCTCCLVYNQNPLIQSLKLGFNSSMYLFSTELLVDDYLAEPTKGS